MIWKSAKFRVFRVSPKFGLWEIPARSCVKMVYAIVHVMISKTKWIMLMNGCEAGTYKIIKNGILIWGGPEVVFTLFSII